MPKTPEGKPATYVNPVYPHSFPDPFVLKFRGEYFAYCTGERDDQRIFGILRSRDLVDWSDVGSAMDPLETRPPFYWAPEVTCDNGKFYLYYSAGNEILMEIRVAVSDRPDGGFVDAGVRLTNEEFAIDAHVFTDDDGTRYMFYATDFLEHSHIGTGTVVDRMIDWKTLEGNPRPVTRAKYDWQVYDPVRKEKGGVRWHTVEGPAVIKRKGKYFEMFSGGNWQNKSYGVSFAVTDSMNFEDEWTQFSDGEKILPILRTILGKVVGPGHNSVVRGPNNRELYCVYHRWTEAGRVLAIDRMGLVGERLFVAGPTTTEQPAPFKPVSGKCLTGEDVAGWSWKDDGLISSSDGTSQLHLNLPDGPFLTEFTVRFLDVKHDGSFTVKLGETEFEIVPGSSKATLRSHDGAESQIKLRSDFDPSAFHLFRIEKGLTGVSVMIDDIGNTAEIRPNTQTSQMLILADGLRAGISAVELTPGFEERFESGDLPAGLRVEGSAVPSHGKLSLRTEKENRDALVSAAVQFNDFEFAADIAADGQGGEYGIALLASESKLTTALTARLEPRTINFEIPGDSVSIDLPEAFTGSDLRQFRLVCQLGRLYAYLDGILLAEHRFSTKVLEAAVRGTTDISVEMVRLTQI
jgi:GH43 family beta-xylosidase